MRASRKKKRQKTNFTHREELSWDNSSSAFILGLFGLVVLTYLYDALSFNLFYREIRLFSVCIYAIYIGSVLAGKRLAVDISKFNFNRDLMISVITANCDRVEPTSAELCKMIMSSQARTGWCLSVIMYSLMFRKLFHLAMLYGTSIQRQTKQ